MFRLLTSNTFRLGILAASISLLFLVGCDSTGQQSSSQSPSFEITNNLSERITPLSGKTHLDASAKKDFQIQGVARVEPPTINGKKASVSHLSSDTNHVFVGYKIVGGDFGGGIDIFDASDPTALGDNKITSVKSQSVDVQEVVDKDTTNSPADVPPLYVAGSKPPSGPLIETNSVAMQLRTSLSGVDVTTARLSGNIAKSVAEAPRADKKHEFYVVPDDSMIFRFDEGLEDRFSQAVEFREWSSVTANQNGIFTLSKSGGIWRSSLDTDGNKPTKVTQLDGSGINPNGIARLQSGRPQNGCPLLFAALNTGGFRALSPGDDGEFRLSRTSGNYTSATMVDGGKFLFAAERNATVEVFEYDPNNQVFNPDPVEIIDTSKFPSGFSGDVQANQVVRTGEYLYVANSTGGVLILKVINGSSPSGNAVTKSQC